MADLPMRWGQLATILFFGGFSWWAIKWVGRNLRAQIGEDRPPGRRTALSDQEIDSIVTRGLASPVQLFQMSATEQRLLATAARAMTNAPSRSTREAAEEGPPTAHCPNCGVLVENWPVEVPWRCECVSCGAALVLRRDGARLVFSYSPRP